MHTELYISTSARPGLGPAGPGPPGRGLGGRSPNTYKTQTDTKTNSDKTDTVS